MIFFIESDLAQCSTKPGSATLIQGLQEPRLQLPVQQHYAEEGKTEGTHIPSNCRIFYCAEIQVILSAVIIFNYIFVIFQSHLL